MWLINLIVIVFFSYVSIMKTLERYHRCSFGAHEANRPPIETQVAYWYIYIYFFHITYICYDIFLAGCSHAFWYEDNDLLMLWHSLIIIIIMLSSRAPTRNIWGWKQQLSSYSDLRGDLTLLYAFKLYYLLGFGWHIVIMSFFSLFISFVYAYRS